MGNKLKVIVEVEHIDGNYMFDVSAHESLSIEEIRSILVGGSMFNHSWRKDTKGSSKSFKRCYQSYGTRLY